MKAARSTLTAGSPAIRPTAPVAVPCLTSVIGNRATREALAGANAPARTPLPPVLAVQLEPSPTARANGGGHGDAAIHAAAARGVATPWSALPHASRIQHAFGRHDISSIQAHVGDTAAASATEMHAEAYTTGNHVVLGRGADLATVAHEAAHVVQQRAGVQLKGGVGAVGDRHEQHADAVAARVTAGQSAEALLDAYAGQGAAGPQIQCRTRIVDHPGDPRNQVAPGTGVGLLQDTSGGIHGEDEFVFGPLHNDCGTSMEAHIDPNDYDDDGTVPQGGSWPNWWAAAAPKPNDYWVRGHLLNHNIGGPGEKRNLTPITKKANSEHLHNIEEFVKMAAEAGDWRISYNVRAIYDGQGPQGLRADATNPHPGVWPMLTVGFDCGYYIVDEQDNVRSFRIFVRNER
jgi:hypothetical protein